MKRIRQRAQHKRILVVGMTDNPGGIEALMMGIINGENSQGIQLDFLVNVKEVAFKDQLFAHGSRIFYVTPRHDNRLKFNRDLRSFFSQHANDYIAVWENANSLANIDYLIYAKKYGIAERIMHCHNSSNSEGLIRGTLHKINRRRIHKYATRFWSVSDEASRWFYGPHFHDLPHYRVFDNAINLDRFVYDNRTRMRIRERLGISSDTVLVGNVGRLHPQKNQSLILHTLAVLSSRQTSIHVIFVGKGDLKQELEDEAKSLGVDSRIHFVGAVDDVAPYYSAMDVFFFPSVFEGLPFALLEAQANCVPCLISTSITQDLMLNDNVVARSITDAPTIWAEELTKLVQHGRVQDSSLRGTRFDLATQKNIFNDLGVATS
ncbi:glycosyltransferase [Bifidobacterium mongoliense]|uniref:glycosyltransferase n=1 Tax=Bifidobacterium mongoliense TaxID=518643 RepID=UPI0030EB34FE